MTCSVDSAWNSVTPAMVMPWLRVGVTSFRVIPEFQVSGSGYKEVPNHFIIDFDVVDDNIIVIVCILVDKFEDILNGEHAEWEGTYFKP